MGKVNLPKIQKSKIKCFCLFSRSEISCGSSCLQNPYCSAFHFIEESKRCEHGTTENLTILSDSNSQQSINVHLDMNYMFPDDGEIIFYGTDIY